jgi:predicted exporter
MEMNVMARRKKLLVPESKDAVDRLKAQVMASIGYTSSPSSPDNVKYEVAKELNIPLKKSNNGNLTSKEAGEIGGEIGGNMVKEMIRMAQKSLKKEDE